MQTQRTDPLVQDPYLMKTIELYSILWRSPTHPYLAEFEDAVRENRRIVNHMCWWL